VYPKVALNSFLEDSATLHPGHAATVCHGADPRTPLAKALETALGTKGTIMAFNAGFERQVMEGLARFVPETRAGLEAAAGRLADLADPFSKGWVLHPGFDGSYSLKAVLPTLVPGMAYDGMEVGDGGAASSAFQGIIHPKTPGDRKAALREALLKYCRQDSLGMAEIVDRLYKMVN
jgi:hypothetical protein